MSFGAMRPRSEIVEAVVEGGSTNAIYHNIILVHDVEMYRSKKVVQ